MKFYWYVTLKEKILFAKLFSDAIMIVYTAYVQRHQTFSATVLWDGLESTATPTVDAIIIVHASMVRVGILSKPADFLVRKCFFFAHISMWRKFCFLVGLEICDECQHWTTGEHCEFCKQGSYGDATAKQGRCHLFRQYDTGS